MKWTAFLVLVPMVLAMASAAQTPGTAPRLDTWKIIGPGGGGTTIDPTVSPHDPNLVLEHCDMTGGYITLDGGNSWRMFNLRALIQTFAFDPSNSNLIYAGNAALWRSDDTGRSWRMIFPNPASNTVEHQNGDESNYSLTSDGRNYAAGLSIRQIVVDPRDSKVIHIAYVDPPSDRTVLLVSTDSGASFSREYEFPPDEIHLLFPVSGGLLAIGAHGVYRSINGAWLAGMGPGETVANASAGEVEGRTYVYAATETGDLLVSEDEGRSWQLRTPALGQQAGRFEVVAAAAGNGRIAYAGFRNLKLGERRQDLYNGIAKTVDAGRNWSIVFKESTHAATNLDASWIEQRAATGPAVTDANADWASIYFDAPGSLSVAPGNPDICYAADLFRTYRTLDGGKTWAQVNSVRLPENRWTTRGLDLTTAWGVQFDPFDIKHIFIDYTDIGLFASHDGGQAWESSTYGVPEQWRNTTYWLAFDPQVKGLVWGAFSGTHDLPRVKMWDSTADSLKYRGGVGVSTDAGRHWSRSNGDMPETAVTHILLDPSSPVGRRILYACGFGRGVYKSTDNGKTWQLKNKGIIEEYPFAWRIARGSEGVLYLILARSNHGQYGDTSGSGALYRSIDGAEHWTKLNLPAGVDGPNGLALDPHDNHRMYLAAWGQKRASVDAGGGLFLSTDGGMSWRNIFSRSQHVYDVTVDPKKPDNIYICTFDAAAYRSTDSGLNWTHIKGYNFKWGHRVFLDPNDAGKIYIATFGGSVWHGPAAGDSKALEDVVTPVPVAQ